MRELIVTEFISIDGIAEVEKLPGVEWNDAMKKFKEDELADSGAMLLGRLTFEIFAGHWPREEGPFAERFNALPKYVASTTLGSVDEWMPAEVLKGSLGEAVSELKKGEGGNIYVHGSLSLARELIRLGLVDRLRLLVYPGAVGQGKRLFAADERTDLRLIHAEPMGNGVLALEYVPLMPS